MKPFIRWPGGKRWLTNIYKDLFPTDYNHYYEPFLGGGAVFFYMLPDNSTLSDINEELINVYIVMRDHPQQLRDVMCKHQECHNHDYYYIIRNHIPSDPVERAGRTLYLNRTCYNGMYRVNRQGMFNVPIGSKNNCIFDIDEFEEYSSALIHAEILMCDFIEVINRANYGDFIFADPPYTTLQGSQFIKFNVTTFSWDDQLRLHAALIQARDRGAKIIHTNANSQDIYNLYVKDGFYVHRINRHSSISGHVKTRGAIEELILTSY